MCERKAHTERERERERASERACVLRRTKVRAVAIPVLVGDTSALWSIKHTSFLLLFFF